MRWRQVDGAYRVSIGDAGVRQDDGVRERITRIGHGLVDELDRFLHVGGVD